MCLILCNCASLNLFGNACHLEGLVKKEIKAIDGVGNRGIKNLVRNNAVDHFFN